MYYMDPSDSFGGHYSLQTVSEVKSVFRFEISDPIIRLHIHIAYMRPLQPPNSLVVRVQ